MNIWRASGLFGLFLLSLFGCKKESSESAQQASQNVPVVAVETSEIRQGDISVVLVAIGQTETLRKEIVSSPISGVVTKMSALEGTTVRPGDVLAIIRAKESQAAITGAQELLIAAVTQEQKAEAEQTLKLATGSQKLVSIKSRISGIVSSLSAVEGSLISDGAEIMTIVDPESIDFVAQVLLKDLISVKIGEMATVNFSQAGTVPFEARITAISPQIDPQTQTVRVRLSFVNVSLDRRIFLKEGFPGKANIVSGLRKNVLMVPTSALLRNDDNNTYTVITITEDSLSLAVPISVGSITDSLAEISGPNLRAGMCVVTAGNYALADSTRVTISPRKPE